MSIPTQRLQRPAPITGQGAAASPTQQVVTVGQVVLLELPWSEVCLHMGVAGQRMRVLVKDGAAQILTEAGGPFSFPVLLGEAGIRINYATGEMTAHVFEEPK